MSNWIFPLQGGVRKTINGRDIGLFVADAGIGPSSVVGYSAPNDSNPGGGWIVVVTLDVWQDVFSLQHDIATNYGGMGAYWVKKLPQIQAILDLYFGPQATPPETNTTPATIADMNTVLVEFFDLVPRPGQSPQFTVNYAKNVAADPNT